jgi:putative methionine-R-sulfoxide reductase with GAF domain
MLMMDLIMVNNLKNLKSNILECSNKVLSELCAPIVNSAGQVIGIIDAESWQKSFFTPERTEAILRICYDLGQINLGL